MTSSGRKGEAFGAENLIDIGDKIVMREHDALGQAGGAAGVGKSGDGLGGGLSGVREWGSRRDGRGC